MSNDLFQRPTTQLWNIQIYHKNERIYFLDVFSIVNRTYCESFDLIQAPINFQNLGNPPINFHYNPSAIFRMIVVTNQETK